MITINRTYMIKQIIYEAVHDGWAQAGVLGAILTGIARWMLTVFGDPVGSITYIGGAVVVIMVIVEKTIGIISKYRQLKKDSKEEDEIDESDQQD